MTMKMTQTFFADEYPAELVITEPIPKFLTPVKPDSTFAIDPPKKEPEDIYTILKRFLSYDLEGIAEKNEARRKLRNLKQKATNRSLEVSNTPDSESDLRQISADMNYLSDPQSEFINREVEIEG